MIPDRRPPVEVAATILRDRYPEALLAFVAGSFNRGEATRYSDIDLVVIFAKLEHAWRESFVFEGWPVEAFVHDPETLRYFFEDVDGRSGAPLLPAMVSEGPAVPASHPLANELKARAEQILNGRPATWDEQVLNTKRYFLTDLLDDLRDPRSAMEAAVTIGALHEQLGDFYFRAQGTWSASKKHVPRRLAKIDPAFAERWEQAFLEAWRGERERLFALVEEVLRPYGGLLFAGYRQNAPPEWRRKV